MDGIAVDARRRGMGVGTRLLISRLGVIGGVCSLGAVFSSQHLVFDLLSHFRMQYVVLIATVLCIALFDKRFWIVSVLTVCLIVHVHEIYRSQKSSKFQVTGKSTTLTIMSSNLLASNDDYARHVNYIESVDPDIVVFQEYTTAWDAALSTALTEYPYKLTVPINNPFGTAIYSKLEFIDERVVYLLNRGRPSLEVSVSSGGRQLKIFGTHPPPPISNDFYTERNLHLQKVAELASTQSGSLVVVGDLNTSPWSDHFRSFIDNGNLSDGRRGHRMLPTWPTWFVPLQIPIDHIIVSNSVKVMSLDSSSGLGSDHRSIWASLQFQ